MIIPGKIEGGQMKLDYQPNLTKLEGKQIKVKITQNREDSRSTEQNRYYWGVVVDILGNELGYHPEEMHDALLAEHSVNRMVYPAKIKRTSDMTVEEMREYIDRVIIWAGVELGIYIPEAK